MNYLFELNIQLCSLGDVMHFYTRGQFNSDNSYEHLVVLKHKL